MPFVDRNRENAEGVREFIFKCLTFFSCVCLMMQIFSIPYRIYIFTSISNKALLLLWILFGCYVLITQLLERVSLPFVCIVFIVLMSFLSFGIAVVFEPQLFGSVGNLLGFFMLPLLLYCIKSTAVSYSVRKIVFVCNFIMSLQYILLYHSSLRHAFQGPNGIVNIESVTLGFPNPNQTATMLLVCVILLFAAIFFFTNKAVRAVFFADFAYLSYIMFQTDSRTSLLLLLLFMVLSFFAIKKRLPKIMTELSLLAPIVYLVLAIAFVSVLEFIQVSGDNIFTGRENIYARYFDNLTLVNFLFGDYAEFQFENLHNGYISIAATLGIVVLIAYYVFLRKILFDAYKLLKKGYESVTYCGLLCLIICMSTEAGFFVGGSMYAFLIAMVFFLIPHAEEKGKRPLENIKREGNPSINDEE